MVYRRFDVLNKRCMRIAPKVYRFCAVSKSRASAHSLLWIYMCLSTAGLQPSRCLCAGSGWQAREGDAIRQGSGQQQSAMPVLTLAANSPAKEEKKILQTRSLRLFRFTTKIGIQG
jgi:hypothetical protein